MTEEIIKAALLGTGKYTPQPSAALGSTGSRIAGLTTDKEDKFLKLAITALLYEEAGRKPLAVEETMPVCPAEVKPAISHNLANRIGAALQSKDEVLFRYFIHTVLVSGAVMPSSLVPFILHKALDSRKDALSLIAVCGESGKWLCGLNPEWQKLSGDVVEENVWDTGSFEARKQYLSQLRTTDPSAALALLTDSIDKENAANRAAFIDVLDINLSLADEPLLLLCLSDKSQKVKESANSLLQKLQGSAVNQRYLDHLLRVILIKDERYMLISKRKTLTIDESPLPGDDIYSSGIGKVSSDKGVPDYLYAIGQMLRYIDPAILSARLSVTADELITLLLQHKDGDYLRPFMAAAAVRFSNRVWAAKLLGDSKVVPISLLDALPPAERVHYYGQFVATGLPALLGYLFDEQYTPMPLALAKQVMEQLAKEPYSIQQPTYQRLALHVPANAMETLINLREAPGQEYQQKYFKAQVAEMVRIMDIKNSIK